MKKIIDFIIKHSKMLTIAFCVLLIIIMAFYGKVFIDNQKVLYHTQLINATKTLRDSMTTAKNNEVRHATDSIQKAQKVIADKAMASADKWKQRALYYERKNEKLSENIDSLLTAYGDSINGPCAEIIGQMRELIHGQQLELWAKDELINDLNEAINADTTGWNACRQQHKADMETINSKVNLLKIKDSTINELTFQLEKNNTFINKNKGLIGLGVGIILGIIVF